MPVPPAAHVAIHPSEAATYTVAEAASLVGVTRNCMYRAARRGEIRSIRIGERVLLSRVDVDRLLAQVVDHSRTTAKNDRVSR